MKIKNVELTYGVALAPMAGVTDRSFRQICKEFGAEYEVSEMVSAKALCYEQRSKKAHIDSATSALAYLEESDLPMAVQLFGSEPDFMAEAAEMIANLSYKGCKATAVPSAIDINMGCPMRKITGNGEGSALMKDPRRAGKIVEACVKRVDLPVTVKIRAGWDRNSINAPEVARILEASGAAAICVHARTREQMYAPGIDISVIENVKKAVTIPVFGNGDIYSADDAIGMMDKTGCDGVMIGRGAQGNPWIFSEIRARLDGKDFTPPTIKERFDLAVRHLNMTVAAKGDRVGLAEAKKHMAWYTAGCECSAKARFDIMNVESYREIIDIFDRLIELEENK